LRVLYTAIIAKVELHVSIHIPTIIMKKLGGLDWLALILVIVGGLNWGLVSLLNWNLVDTLFGTMSTLSQIVYGLVGLSAIYVLAISGKLGKK